MSPYQKFDPYKSLTPERPAKVAKEGTEKLARPITLAGLATLAAHRAENTNSAFRSIASLQDEADEIHRPFSITPSLTDIPTDWVAGLRAIAERPCPITIEPKRWRQFQGDANRFVDQWVNKRLRWAGRPWIYLAVIRRIRRTATTPPWAWSG
jgi:hypothetical protein